jgi:hypothetical protein
LAVHVVVRRLKVLKNDSSLLHTATRVSVATCAQREDRHLWTTFSALQGVILMDIVPEGGGRDHSAMTSWRSFELTSTAIKSGLFVL